MLIYWTKRRRYFCWVTLKMDTSILDNFRASLIHLETVEIDISTYDWIKLISKWERLFSFFLRVANMYALYAYSEVLPQRSLSSVYSQNSRLGKAFPNFQF